MPQLVPCGSSGRAWRLWAAQHSQGEGWPLGSQPLPQVLEPASSRVAGFTRFIALAHLNLEPGRGILTPTLDQVSSPVEEYFLLVDDLTEELSEGTAATAAVAAVTELLFQP